MKIDLKPWQKEMLEEAFQSLPQDVSEVLDSRVKRICYHDQAVTDGHLSILRSEDSGTNYGNGLITLGKNLLHPRYFLEMALHEIGHEFEDLFMREADMYSGERFDFSERFADGLPF